MVGFGSRCQMESLGCVMAASLFFFLFLDAILSSRRRRLSRTHLNFGQNAHSRMVVVRESGCRNMTDDDWDRFLGVEAIREKLREPHQPWTCDHRLVPRVHFTRRQAMCISGPTRWMLESAWLAVEAGRSRGRPRRPRRMSGSVGIIHGEARERGRQHHPSCPGPEMQ